MKCGRWECDECSFKREIYVDIMHYFFNISVTKIRCQPNVAIVLGRKEFNMYLNTITEAKYHRVIGP